MSDRVSKLSIELAWLMYVVFIGTLSLLERLVTPEAAGFDRILDAALNLGSLLGLVALAAWSFVWFRAGPETARRARAGRAVLGGVLGPLLGVTLVTNLAHDVDGSTWMLAAPVLGLLLVIAALFAAAMVEPR